MTSTAAAFKVLVIEDEPKIASLLIDYLHRDGYDTACCRDGHQAMAMFAAESPDLVLLDVMLPGKDGLQLCREIREISAVPVIMVTARIEEVDRLLGLELGADDYICKPFSPREVIARIKAIFRRLGHRQALREGRARGPFSVDDRRMTITLDDQPLPLTLFEYRMLSAMVARPGQVFSRDQLLSAAADELGDVSDRAVDSHVKNLRKKLALVRPGQSMIAAVYGVGYRLEET